jgi:hypothetical protein
MNSLDLLAIKSGFVNSINNEKNSLFSLSNLETNSDCDLGISLIFKDVVLANIGISYGLEKYYLGIEDFEDNNYQIEKMIFSAQGKWGVTLLQSSKGKKLLRQEFSESIGSYRDILFKNLEKISKENSLNLSFYLPGEYVFWNLESIKDINLQGFPEKEVLKKNYDDVAKNFGFKFNPDSNLYER